MPGKGGLQLTGKLGEVIRESAQIALSWTKAHAHALGVTEDPSTMILNDRDVHWHPHVMIFVAGDAEKSWGANVEGSPVIAAPDPEERVTILMVPVWKAWK